MAQRLGVFEFRRPEVNFRHLEFRFAYEDRVAELSGSWAGFRSYALSSLRWCAPFVAVYVILLIVGACIHWLN